MPYQPTENGAATVNELAILRACDTPLAGVLFYPEHEIDALVKRGLLDRNLQTTREGRGRILDLTLPPV